MLRVHSFIQIIEGLLYARCCAGHWECSEDEIDTLTSLPRRNNYNSIWRKFLICRLAPALFIPSSKVR